MIEPTIDLARIAFRYLRSPSPKRSKRNANGENKNRGGETNGRGKEEERKEEGREGRREGRRETEIEKRRERKREKEDILFLAASLYTSQKPVLQSPRSSRRKPIAFVKGF